MSENTFGADNQQGRLSVNLTPDYIVGLVDGEGYFSVSAFVDKSKGWNSQNVRMVFGIQLNAEDGQILYNVRDFFGCGTVWVRKSRRENWSDCLELQIKDLKSLSEIIIPFFKKHPLKFPKKKLSFEKFTEIANIKLTKEHIGEVGFLKVKNLAEKIHT